MCRSPPGRFSYRPPRWASHLDKAQGLHLHLRCDDAEAPSPSSSALMLLSAGNPTSFSSLTIGQPRTVKYACHVSLRHLSAGVASAMPLDVASMGPSARPQWDPEQPYGLAWFRKGH